MAYSSPSIIRLSYLRTANCAVVHSFFLVRPGKSHNRRHECERILERLDEEMKAQALFFGHISGIDSVFLEAIPEREPGAAASVLDVCSDHLLLSRLGFLKLQMHYLRPEDQQERLLLVRSHDAMPRSEFDPSEMFVPSTLVMDMLSDRFEKVPQGLVRQVELQEGRGILLLSHSEWGDGQGVLVDLYDDWDEDLARAVHARLGPGEGVEAFEVWRKLMQEDEEWVLEERAEPTELHVLARLDLGGEVH